MKIEAIDPSNYNMMLKACQIQPRNHNVWLNWILFVAE